MEIGHGNLFFRGQLSYNGVGGEDGFLAIAAWWYGVDDGDASGSQAFVDDLP